MADLQDPLYGAGVKAGLAIAVSYLEGRASMAREMTLSVDAKALDAAAKALAALGRTRAGASDVA